MPLKYLIVTSTRQGDEQILVRDFHNLMGRAGRAGLWSNFSDIFEGYAGGAEHWPLRHVFRRAILTPLMFRQTVRWPAGDAGTVVCLGDIRRTEFAAVFY